MTLYDPNRKQKIIEMRKQGYSQERIAKVLGITQQAVSINLKGVDITIEPLGIAVGALADCLPDLPPDLREEAQRTYHKLQEYLQLG